MSPFTCISTLLVIGLVLMPSLNAYTTVVNEVDEARELLAKLTKEETNTRGVDIDVAKAQIQALNDIYKNFVTSHDAKGIVAMYEPDAVRISNGVSKTGLDGYEANMNTWLKYVDEAKITIETLLPLDKDAKFVIEKNSFEMYGPSPPKTLIQSGTTFSVWKLTDDGYKVAIELNKLNNN